MDVRARRRLARARRPHRDDAPRRRCGRRRRPRRPGPRHHRPAPGERPCASPRSASGRSPSTRRSGSPDRRATAAAGTPTAASASSSAAARTRCGDAAGSRSCSRERPLGHARALVCGARRGRADSTASSGSRGPTAPPRTCGRRPGRSTPTTAACTGFVITTQDISERVGAQRRLSESGAALPRHARERRAGCGRSSTRPDVSSTATRTWPRCSGALRRGGRRSATGSPTSCRRSARGRARRSTTMRGEIQRPHHENQIVTAERRAAGDRLVDDRPP